MFKTPNQNLVYYIVCANHFLEEALLINLVNVS